MLSVITATFNKLELSQDYLSSLEANPPDEPWEIIWVDDGSTDGTRDWLQNLPAPRHRVIFNNQNLGYAASNNRGAQIAQGEILVLLNNDLVLTPGWYKPMIASLTSIKHVGMVGNIQIQPKTGRIDHAGVIFDLVGLPDHHLKNRGLRAAKGAGHFFNATTAACCMIRRDVFLSVGGFDERYQNGCEDLDLCLRLQAQGYRHWVDYHSVVHHHVSSSPGRKTREQDNLRLFLSEWGSVTRTWGERDWPKNYLSRHLWSPARLNGPKTLDALLRLLRFRKGPSAWAEKIRSQILSD
ncbi:MAG: glycosyltransferase [Opitutaceae bacterium]|jgi:GT2 family glycosyltransferase